MDAQRTVQPPVQMKSMSSSSKPVDPITDNERAAREAETKGDHDEEKHLFTIFDIWPGLKDKRTPDWGFGKSTLYNSRQCNKPDTHSHLDEILEDIKKYLKKWKVDET